MWKGYLRGLLEETSILIQSLTVGGACSMAPEHLELSTARSFPSGRLMSFLGRSPIRLLYGQMAIQLCESHDK